MLKILAAGRRVGVVRGAVVLQELIHRLERLIVLVKDLQVLDGGRSLDLAGVGTGDAGEGSTADQKNEGKGAGEGRAELAASVE